MKLLTNGSKYKICNVEHTIKDNLIIKKPITMTEKYKLERLYLVIKYTTKFLEENDIDYCAESGTLLGCIRHNGIIPWDNDVDIMIFKEGYLKMKTLMNKYNNEPFRILHITPGFKLFYKDECYGELFVYDIDEKMDLYRQSFPYINDKPTFITSNIYYNHLKFKKDIIFPTQKILFEDFYIRMPNNLIEALSITFKGNLLECKYIPELNNQHEIIHFKKYNLFSSIEKIICNKILIFIYIILHWFIAKIMITTI